MVDEPGAYYTEWSKSEREKQILYITAYIWNLEKWYQWTYLPGRNRDADVENGLVDSVGKGECGMNWESSIESYTSPCVKYIASVKFKEGNGTPLQYSCLENPMDGGAWKAAVHGVSEGWTRLSDFTFTFHFHALEKEMATHSSTVAWKIPRTRKPGGLPSMGSHRVGHDWSNLAAAAAAVGSCCITQGAQPAALWQPSGVIWRGGREAQGEQDRCILIADSPCSTAETNTTL